MQVVVEITIPRNALQYAARVGQYSADLVVASFLADRQRRPISDVRKTVNVKFSTLEGETSGDRRIEVVLRHEAPVDPAYVMVVVYQYDADRLGSALARVR